MSVETVIGVEQREEAVSARVSGRVTMHVVSPVRNDERILREATALQAAGMQIAVVDVEERGSCSPVEEIRGMMVWHVLMAPTFAATRFTRYPIIRALRVFVLGILYLLKVPTDMYHAHDTIALPACAFAALVRRKPLIFDAHELPLAGLRLRQPLLRALLQLLLAQVIKRCTGVITVSAPIAQEIRTRYKAKEVTLLRNTPIYQEVRRANLLRETLGLSSQTRIALYQGNIQRDRQLDKLVQAVRFFAPNIVLVLMGKDMRNFVPELEALARREGVAERVFCLPPVLYKDLLAWTSSADVGLIIYQPDYSLNVKMCLPNKLFEYMMAGLPVLATQLEAVAEVLKTYHVGQTINSLEPEQIAHALNELVSDPVQLEQLHENALIAARYEFRWEREQQQLIGLYQGIQGRDGVASGGVQ